MCPELERMVGADVYTDEFVMYNSPLETETPSLPLGFVVPTPTLPDDKIVTAGVVKFVPPAAVEGVISKALLTRFCAPILQLVNPPLDVINSMRELPAAEAAGVLRVVC